MYHSIHTLRGFAAVAIAVLHAGPPMGLWQLNSAVVLFFIISGFVIFVSNSDRPFSLGTYLARRILRIYPLWWVAMAWFCGVTLITILGVVPNSRQIFESIILFPTQGRDMRMEPIPFLGWTLVYEMFFYILFGLAMALGRWWIALLVTLGLGAAGLLMEFENFYLHIVTRSYFFAFAIGMVLAWATLKGFRAPPWVALIGLAGLLLGLREPFGNIFWCALIVAGALGFEERWPRSRVAEFLGSASYSIYLFHPSVTVVFTTLYTNVPWVTVAAGGLAIGCLAHVIVERPLMRWTSGVRAPRAPKLLQTWKT